MSVSSKRHLNPPFEVTHNKPFIHGHNRPGVQFLTYVIPFRKHNLSYFHGNVTLQYCKGFTDKGKVPCGPI